MDKWKVEIVRGSSRVQKLINNMDENGYEFKAITDNRSNYTLVFRQYNVYPNASWGLAESTEVDVVESVEAPSLN